MSDEDFACWFCQFQPPDPWLTDKDENGEEYFLLEVSNEKRYGHYLRDFDEKDSEELKRHLVRRVRYLAQGDKAKIELGMGTIEATLEWWKIAKKVRRDGASKGQSPFAERIRAEYEANRPKQTDETTEAYNREKARQKRREEILAQSLAQVSSGE